MYEGAPITIDLKNSEIMEEDGRTFKIIRSLNEVPKDSKTKFLLQTISVDPF